MGAMRGFFAVALAATLGCAGAMTQGGGAGHTGSSGSNGAAAAGPPAGAPGALEERPGMGPALTLSALQDATYPCDLASGGWAELRGGIYREDFAAGTHEPLTVTLIDKQTGWGDLDGDGNSDAVVILKVDAGRPGIFYHMIAVLNRDGIADPVADLLLGDRVRVNNVNVANGQILLDVTRQGPHDPVGNPTWRVKETYELQGHRLERLEQIEVLR